MVAGNDSIVVDVEDKGNGPGVTIRTVVRLTLFMSRKDKYSERPLNRSTPLWAEKPATIKNDEVKSYADLNTKEDQKCDKQDDENQWETEEELQYVLHRNISSKNADLFRSNLLREREQYGEGFPRISLQTFNRSQL